MNSASLTFGNDITEGNHHTMANVEYYSKQVFKGPA